jgi:hypothetical protein
MKEPKPICGKCYRQTRNLVAVPENPKEKELESLKEFGIICMTCLRKKYKGELLV